MLLSVGALFADLVRLEIESLGRRRGAAAHRSAFTGAAC